MKNKAKFKFNNGNLSLNCSKCNKIIKDGKDFTELEMIACRNISMYYLPPQYCDECKRKEDERNSRKN